MRKIAATVTFFALAMGSLGCASQIAAGREYQLRVCGPAEITDAVGVDGALYQLYCVCGVCEVL